MSKQHNIVYKITNKLNGKKYIGVHSTDDLNDGYMGSGANIIAAIKKYGIENFKKEILVDYDTAEVAYRLEKMLVNEDFVKRRDTYNLSCGGLGGSHTAWNKGLSWSIETRKKISESKKNPSEDTRRKLSESHKGKTPWNKGLKMTDEQRKKCSEANKGRTSHRKGLTLNDEYGERAEEVRKNISNSHKGKTFSPEHRAKITDGLKRYNKRRKEIA